MPSRDLTRHFHHLNRLLPPLLVPRAGPTCFSASDDRTETNMNAGTLVPERWVTAKQHVVM